MGRKVLLVGPSLDSKGGMVTVLKALSAGLVKKGHEVTVVQTTAPGKFLSLVSAATCLLRVLFYCALRRVDLVHFNVASRVSFFRKLILSVPCLLFRVPYVVHLHGAEFDIFYEKELGGFNKWLVRMFFRKAAAVVTLSGFWKNWVSESMRLDFVNVIWNGVPPVDIEGKSSSNIVLFLGELCQRKGTDVLILAMRKVLRVVPSAILELGGNGDLRKYEELAAGIENVKFLGWIDDEKRQEALSRAGVFCLPSWREGLPMSILEAMSAGLPVISTPVGGIPEAVEHGVTGFLVDPGDVDGLAEAICEVLNNKQLADKMGYNGYCTYKKSFSDDSMVDNFLEVYERCLS